MKNSGTKKLQSMVHEFTGSWRKASGPFWHLEHAGCATLQLLDRGGSRCSVVAVYNPSREDYRIKVWLDPAAERPSNWFAMSSAGYEFQVEHVGNGFHQKKVHSRSLYRCLHGIPKEPGSDVADEEEDRDDPGFLDVCIQTQFASVSENPGRSQLPGTLEGVPTWMKAESISISHPDGGGGWPGIQLRAPGIQLVDSIYGSGVPAMRVNGVWMLSAPLAEPDSSGMCAYRGLWALQCDPVSLEAARSGGATATPVEPMPPREIHLLRKLKRVAGFGWAEYGEWRDAIRDWRNCVVLLSDLHGRYRRCSTIARDRRDKMRHYERILGGRLKRYVAQGGRAASVDELVAALKGTKTGSLLQNWRDERNGSRSMWQRYSAEAEELEPRIAEQRELHDELLAKLEEFEEKYEDAIEFLSSDPPS